MATPDNDRIRRLAEQARSGNRAAFSEIAKTLMNQVVALTYRMTGDRESAMDLTQETFVSAWEHLKNFRGDAKFESWLYRIAVNKTLHYLDSHKNRPHDDINNLSEAAAITASPDDEMSQKELQRNILSFMQSLPEQQRLVFELRFYRQMQFDEISSVTGKALGTAKTLYREAIKKLREHALQKGWRP